jgi:hypothetical protein
MAEVEFRDGKREVPDHVGAMVAGLETYTMTYEQAIKAAERRMLEDHVWKAQQSLIDAHFRVVP